MSPRNLKSTRQVVKMTIAQWRNTHKDYKSIKDGRRYVLTYVPGTGTVLSPVMIVDDTGKDILEH